MVITPCFRIPPILHPYIHLLIFASINLLPSILSCPSYIRTTSVCPLFTLCCCVVISLSPHAFAFPIYLHLHPFAPLFLAFRNSPYMWLIYLFTAPPQIPLAAKAALTQVISPLPLSYCLFYVFFFCPFNAQ
jgi:hypothetical protein